VRLTVGLAGGPGRWLSLAPESFASGPVGGRVLAGSDDGTVSWLSLVDPGHACATAVTEVPDVVRSAVLAADGQSIFEHRVDRVTRADLGVWRRPLATDGTSGGAAERVLPGLAPDAVHGRTFTTELLAGDDGRLTVSSCGLEACRVRVLDPSGASVANVEDVGPAIGLHGRRLVARAACAGDPCGIVTVDLATGARGVAVDAALASAMDGSTLVYEVPGGRIATLDLATRRRTGPVDAGGTPVRRGSLALAGVDVLGGTVALAPGGRPTTTGLRALDTTQGTATNIGEVRR
jgi:hypothetical protein